MKLYNLKSFYVDMLRNKKKQETFSFIYGKIKFEVIFLIDRNPFEMLIGAIGQPLAFILKIHPGFNIELIPNDKFFKLCKILNLIYGKQRFTSWMFLDHLNTNIPNHITKDIVQPHAIARYKSNSIPDNEKIYFIGWNNHLKDKRFARNFEKTKLLMGDDVADYCMRRNISSMWSSMPRESINYFTPWDV